MTNGTPGSKPTKNEKRLAAREKAQQARLEQKKKERRNRLLLQVGIVVGILAVAEIGRASCRERVEISVADESSRRRHTRCGRDWSSDVCSSDLSREN